MFQVTIIWEGAEIGYGEGAKLSYAKREAMDSVSSFYAMAKSEWKFLVRKGA